MAEEIGKEELEIEELDNKIAPLEKQGYDNLTLEEPERQVDIDLPAGDGHKSLAQQEIESPNLTDLQASLKRLFPQFPHEAINRVAQVMMVSRVDPDTFLPLLNSTVYDINEALPWDADITFQEILSLCYGFYTIGRDGKGRIDVFALHGAAKEQEELDKIGKELGFAS